MTKLNDLYQGDELAMVKEDFKKTRKIITNILNGKEINESEWFYIEMITRSLNEKLKTKH